LSPVPITKGEFEAVKQFRKTGRPEDMSEGDDSDGFDCRETDVVY
jgi:hypothetical protein